MFVFLTDLPYQMFLPPGFDESKKYPLLIDVYELFKNKNKKLFKRGPIN